MRACVLKLDPRSWKLAGRVQARADLALCAKALPIGARMLFVLRPTPSNDSGARVDYRPFEGPLMPLAPPDVRAVLHGTTQLGIHDDDRSGWGTRLPGIDDWLARRPDLLKGRR